MKRFLAVTASRANGPVRKPDSGRGRLLGAAVILSISAYSLWSQSSFYLNRGDYTLAAQALPGNQQFITFFLPSPPFPHIGLLPELTISDLTFRSRDLNRGPNGSLWNYDSDFPLSIQFANGARAFGADFSSAYTNVPSFAATLSLDNGETFQFTTPTTPGFTFFGFISTTPIMNVTFSDGGLFRPGPVPLHEELIGNIFVVTVPEVSSLAFFCLGGFLLAAHLSHKRLGRLRFVPETSFCRSIRR